VVKNYVKKGSKLYIEGALQTRKWTDNAGVEKYSTEIVLQGYSSVLTMIDSQRSAAGDDSFSSGSANGSSSSFDNNYKSSNNNDSLEDEIPF
jgi:single-strand DNA-binding protein